MNTDAIKQIPQNEEGSHKHLQNSVPQISVNLFKDCKCCIYVYGLFYLFFGNITHQIKCKTKDFEHIGLLSSSARQL